MGELLEKLNRNDRTRDGILMATLHCWKVFLPLRWITRGGGRKSFNVCLLLRLVSTGVRLWLFICHTKIVLLLSFFPEALSKEFQRYRCIYYRALSGTHLKRTSSTFQTGLAKMHLLFKKLFLMEHITLRARIQRIVEEQTYWIPGLL